MAKYDYHVELACPCCNTLYRSAPLKAQTHENGIYVVSAMIKFTGAE